jgi:hypothetical protein
MKGIHAMGTILAVWRIDSSGPAPSLPPRPARANQPPAKSSHEDGMHAPSGRGDSNPSRVGIPSLLAAALLQGGASTNRRRN